MSQLPTRSIARCPSSSESDGLADMISCGGWPDCYQEHSAFKPHCIYMEPEGGVGVIVEYLEGCAHDNSIMSGVIIGPRSGNRRPRMLAIKRHRCCDDERSEATTAILSQQRSTEDDLKILLRILSTNFTIASLIHLRDYALYACTPVDIVPICTATSCRTLLQPSLQFGRAPFNSHLPSGFLFLQTQEYRLPGAKVYQHRRITIRGIFRGVVV